LPVPFVDRHPTPEELERLRLVLSTYQDGSGMLKVGSITLPGWRDFERSTAVTFDGIAQESKAIFDVLIPNPDVANVNFGVSCKMRREFERIVRTGRASLELSNSAGKFWTELGKLGLNLTNYKTKPKEVGAALLGLIHRWHEEVDLSRGGLVDVGRSFYLSLMWSLRGNYQLHQFSLELPDPSTLTWSFPSRGDTAGKLLRGADASGSVIEWYGESGGQLKYYPLVTDAIWESPIFQLEPLAQGEYGVLTKARSYFGDKWPR